MTHGPSGASGGSTACSREPSASRASTIGDARSSRRPSGAMHPLDDAHDRVGVELARDRLDAAVALDEHAVRPVHHDLGDRRVGEQRLERPEPVDVVDQLVEHDAAAVAALASGASSRSMRGEAGAQLAGAERRGIERRGEQPPVQRRRATRARRVGVSDAAHAASSSIEAADAAQRVVQRARRGCRAAGSAARRRRRPGRWTCGADRREDRDRRARLRRRARRATRPCSSIEDRADRADGALGCRTARRSAR